MPFATAAFDCLSMGYALRHVADLLVTFQELFRVLKPGGSLLILEFARPRTRSGYLLARLYLDRLVPSLSRLASGNAETRVLMRYCWDTVDTSVPAETIRAAIQAGGFVQVEHETFLGLLIEYRARKPGG